MSDFVWAAGLFEGEGNIHLAVRDGRNYLILQMASTDLDVLERFKSVVGCGAINGPYRAKYSTKDCWTWRVQERSKVLALLNKEEFITNLGRRRSQKIAEGIEAINNQQPPKTRRKCFDPTHERRGWQCLNCKREYSRKRYREKKANAQVS